MKTTHVDPTEEHASRQKQMFLKYLADHIGDDLLSPGSRSEGHNLTATNAI